MPTIHQQAHLLTQHTDPRRRPLAPAGFSLAVILLVVLLSASASLDVCAQGGTPAYVMVSPGNPEVPVGQQQTFFATCYDSSFNMVYPMSWYWSMMGGSGTFWYNGSSASFTPTSPGSFQIMVTAYGWGGGSAQGYVSGYATYTPTPTLVILSPSSATISLGQWQFFSATCYDQIGYTMPMSFLWTADGGSISTNGVYTPTNSGNFYVTATAAPGVYASSSVRVEPLARIEIGPAETTAVLGRQTQFTAIGYNTNNIVVYPLSPTWTATGGTINPGGFYTPTNYGDYTVTASCGTNSSSATVHVRFSLTGCEYRSAANCVVLTWPSLAGRAYEVYRATNLFNPQWQLVASNLVATPPQNTWSNAILPGTPAFFFRALDRSP